MTELAVVGTPFLDITFEGAPRVPSPGEEILARGIRLTPGGTGVQAIAGARLGLTTTLVAPLGHDGTAALVRRMLESEGVTVAGPPVGAVPTTALISTDGETAMVTAPAGDEPSAAEVAEVGASAVLLSIGRLSLAPGDASLYAVTGTLELEHVTAATLANAPVRALILTAEEASALSGHKSLEAAIVDLASRVETVVVTRGAEGAIARTEDHIERALSPDVAVVNATGAGDLFAVAYLWADVRGAPLADRIAWACLYAGLSLRASTAQDGALRLTELLHEGTRRGLTPPPA